MAQEIIQIVLLRDGDGTTCYPQTNGEAITVKVGAGEEKKTIPLDEYLQNIFLNVYTNIIPTANLDITIGDETHKIGEIFAKKISVDSLIANTLKANTSVEGKAVVASEQIKLGDIVLTQDPNTKRLKPTAGIEGAVWN